MTTWQLKTISEILNDMKYQFVPASALTALIANAIGATYDAVEKFLCQIKK